MAKPILMPQVGQDLTEGKLIEWRIKVGDTVGKGDIVAVVESEKASFEVEAFEAGTVIELLYEEGATTEVLAPLAFLGEPGEASGSTPQPAPPAVVAVQAPEPEKPLATLPIAAVAKTKGAPRSSPLARRIARDSGLDLAALTGSGPQGAIVKRDIDEVLASRKTAPATAETAPASATGGLHRVWLRKGTGDPVVLIHGFGADHNAWRVLVAAAALSRPVLAVDLPGHGRSAGHGATSAPDIVAALAAVLRDEAIEAADLVGHSLGAAFAVALAETAAFTVRSLLLISPAGLGPDVNGAFVSGFLRAESETSLAPWMKLLVADESAMGPAVIRVTAEARAMPGVMTGQAAVAQALLPNGTQVLSVRHAIAGLACPVRIVFGAADRIIPPHHATGLPGTVAVHILPGVGHMPPLEARDILARILKEHLRSAE